MLGSMLPTRVFVAVVTVSSTVAVSSTLLISCKQKNKIQALVLMAAVPLCGVVFELAMKSRLLRPTFRGNIALPQTPLEKNTDEDAADC